MDPSAQTQVLSGPGHCSHLGVEQSSPWKAGQDSSSLSELRLGPSGLEFISL